MKTFNIKISFLILLLSGVAQGAPSEGWENFLRNAVKGYLGQSGHVYSPTQVYETMRTDRSWKDGAWQCLDRLKEFSYIRMGRRLRAQMRGQGNNHTYTYDFEVSDQEYLAQRTGKEHFELPPAISKKLAHRIKGNSNTVDSQFWRKRNWEEFDGLETANEKWRVLQYSSRLVNNPSEGLRSLQRVLMLREVDTGTRKYDQWIQFTVDPPASTSSPGSVDNPFNPVGTGTQNLVDFISVQYKAPQNERLNGEPVNEDGTYKDRVLSFRQWWRVTGGFFQESTRDRLAQTRTNDQCYMCHANGMRELSPVQGSVWNKPLKKSVWAAGKEQTQLENLKYMNKKMRSYGRTSWGKILTRDAGIPGNIVRAAITPENYGPPLGRAVGCATCHNNRVRGSQPDVSRGAINWGFLAHHSYHKLTRDASMPMNDRGAHGIARQFIWDVTAGLKTLINKDVVIEGDTSREIYRNILRQSAAGESIANTIELVDRHHGNMSQADKAQIDDRIGPARAAARYADRNNRQYAGFLFRGSNSYGPLYQKETGQWLLDSCDLDPE